MINEKFLRNLGTLTVEEQLKIEDTKIGVAGCGLGSEVARQLTRFGFTISVLADPDTVDIHNLNRQNYHHIHIDTPKVEALRDNLQLINPDLDPFLYPEGITKHNYKEFVEKADIIIDAIDPTYIHLSLALTREAHRQGKTVVTAIDFGFGARLFVFPHDGIDIMEFMSLDRHVTDEAILNMPTEQVMQPYMAGEIPEYSLRIIEALSKGELDFYPQNILAVAQASVMITAACKRIALGQPVISAPNYIHIDLDWMLANS